MSPMTCAPPARISPPRVVRPGVRRVLLGLACIAGLVAPAAAVDPVDLAQDPAELART